MPDDNSPEDIQSILSDLDQILSGLGEAAAGQAPAPPPPGMIPKPMEAARTPPPKPVEPVKPIEPPKAVEPVKAAAPPKPVEAPKPTEPPKPVEPVKAAAPPKPVEPPKPAEPPKPVEAAKPLVPENKVELAPREGMIFPTKPAPVKAEAPKPEPAKPAPAPAPVPATPPAPATPAASKPGAAVPVTPGEEIPPGSPKEQIRRIAYFHTFACLEARTQFAAFLSQAARTISKKPLFIRQVLSLEVTGASDPNALFEKARDAKAVAVFAVVEGWPPAKVEAVSEACSRGGVLFRTIAPGDVQKKSTAVDVIVDMMLLPGEA
jgi:hypothetical protein